MSKMRVAVVGGGIFGITAAVEIARAGHKVDLFEREPDLLRGASGINQYRLHRGYHYPRSPETAVQSKISEVSFIERYRDAILTEHLHYYAIARSRSLVSVDEYLKFCSRQALEYELDWPTVLRRPPVALCMKVRESLFDPLALRQLCNMQLKKANVRVHLNTPAAAARLAGYDFTVVATYSAINDLMPARGPVQPAAYQFEVCEKPVVRLPRTFAGKSVVVLDGPFMCVDPFGRTGLFVLGNVEHAIHHRNIGLAAEVPEVLKPLLNRGLIERPPITRFGKFIDSAREFFEGIEEAEHVGSMFTIRAVLKDVEATDARPTIVAPITAKMASIFSGKIGTCVEAASEVLRLIENSAS